MWLGFIFSTPSTSFAAITLTGSTCSQSASTSSTASVACNAGASADGLIVFTWSNNAVAISSCTYNSVSLDLIANITGSAGTGAGILILSSPASGSNTLACTWANATGDVYFFAEGLIGLNSPTASSYRTAYTANDSTGSDPPSLTVVNSQNGDLVVDNITSYPTAGTQGGGQTLWNQTNPLGGSIVQNVSRESATGASTIMSWSGTGLFYAHAAVALIPSGGGGPTLKIFWGD